MSVYPTLSVQPSYPLQPDGEIEDAVLRSKLEGGYEQTRPKFTRVRRSWGINYSHLPDADVATLRTFESVTLRNGADFFTWVHPISGTTYTVRLAEPIKYARTTAPGHCSVSLSIREV